MQHYQDLPSLGENWFTYPNLYRAMVQEFGSGSRFAEIGVWKGRSAAFMGVEIINSNKDIKLHCIDTFGGSIEHVDKREILDGTLYDVCVNNLKPVSSVVEVFKNDSVLQAAAYEDKSFEFVFIDGDHTYDGVKRDIEAWLSKVKDGCILAGHDYGWPNDTGRWEVREAVEDFFRPMVEEVSFGCFADPWGNGCWILRIDQNGNPQKYQTNLNKMFVYER